MPAFLAIPLGYWLLGGATAAMAVWASPVGEPARKATERALTDAFSNSDARTNECTNGCERCPVCGRLENPTPGQTPGYLQRNDRPMDYETYPPLQGSYRRTQYVVKGARVYERPNGTFIHVDTQHKGMDAELEVYDRRKKHIGTICPQCGASLGGPVPGRTINDSHIR